LESESLHIVKVIVAAGWDELAVLQAAVSPFLDSLQGDGSGTLTLAIGDARLADQRRPILSWCAETIGARFKATQIVAPTKLAMSGWVRSARTRDPWAAVDVSARSDRLDVAWLRRELADATTLIVINEVAAGKVNEPLVLGMWAMFAHPRQRIGALAGDDRTGLRAELAVAVQPSLAVLLGESHERPLVIVTQDQLAAELTGRALQSIDLPDPFGEAVGPWELPLIQRATELKIGIKLPLQLDIEAIWAGEPGEPGEQLHAATVDQIRLALGASQH
jgi:hypothetical protein